MRKIKTPKIAAAAGTAGAGGKAGLGKLIEKAMARAIADCFAKGITDDNAIRQAQLDARSEAKAKFQSS